MTCLSHILGADNRVLVQAVLGVPSVTRIIFPSKATESVVVDYQRIIDSNERLYESDLLFCNGPRFG